MSDNVAKPRSFLKWAGGKFKLLDRIAKHIPPTTARTIEPFAGSAVFSLNLGRGQAIINDLNADLIQCYRHLITDCDALLIELRELFVVANNDKDAYLALRKEFNASSPTLRKSALFIYLNKHGFNGLMRYNASGGFNVPFGKYASVALPEEALRDFASRCKDFTFECKPFENVLADVRENDLIYADPPYVSSQEFASSFTTYTKSGFKFDDQQRLVECAREARASGAAMIISNHYTPETEALYADANRVEVLDVNRSISCKGEQRMTVKECLAIYG